MAQANHCGVRDVTDESDCYPILSDIPLDATASQLPDPGLPAPDKSTTLELALTKHQQKNYKASTEKKTGTALKQLAAEVEEDTRQGGCNNGKCC